MVKSLHMCYGHPSLHENPQLWLCNSLCSTGLFWTFLYQVCMVHVTSPLCTYQLDFCSYLFILFGSTMTGWWFQSLWKICSSVGMIIPFPSVSGKSFKIPWFQSPPTSITSLTIIHGYYPWLTIINHYFQSITIIHGYYPWLTIINHYFQWISPCFMVKSLYPRLAGVPAQCSRCCCPFHIWASPAVPGIEKPWWWLRGILDQIICDDDLYIFGIWKRQIIRYL